VPAGAGKDPYNPESFGWDKAWDTVLAKDSSALRTQLYCDNTTATWTNGSVPAAEILPINCVSWYDAFAFCVWDGGRLPTEAEWNFAAAGGDEQRFYPWSDPPSSTTIDSTYAVYATSGALFVGSRSKHPARWGHEDLSGNIGEWVKDYDGPYPVPCDNCEDLGQGGVAPHIYRGGSWQHPVDQVNTTYRAFPSFGPHTGFRCARDP
jgi:formylglycine-generating enzyme required for sulfatase activity